MAGTAKSRPRIGEEETRRRLLELAGDRLVTHGLTVGLDAIRMEKLIQEADVSRATAYRCWPHREDFLTDALVATVRNTSLIPEGEAEIGHLTGMLTRHRGQLGSEQGRRDLVVEALRVSLDADIRRMLASPRWRLFMALEVTYRSLPQEVRATVGQALAEMEGAFVGRRAAVYAGMAGLIGYRQRAPFTGESGFVVLSTQTGLSMRGILSRALGDPGWLDERTELTLFGARAPARWSQAEIAVTSVLLTHLEPDPSITWDEAHIQAAEDSFIALAATLGHTHHAGESDPPPA